MENIFKKNGFLEQKRNRRCKGNGFRGHRGASQCIAGTLASASINEEYIIKAVEINHDEMRDFLFTLGCYEGEAITVISILSDQYVVVIKDARYSIDKNLASGIII
ncbi:MAG: FeoA family protein [Clostridium sp.]|uniref:FeoA family protein n=1 Tax=Clostridium sp. TaxID=1506 RepID=UPI003D6D4D13